MDIIYLDQNKWIELARVQAGALTSGPILDLYRELAAAVQSEKVLFPLSATHVMETSKQNNHVNRTHLAETQAKLNRGFAYRSRAGRLEVEVRATLLSLFDLKPTALSQYWAIAPSFLEAFEAMDSLIAPASAVSSLKRIYAHMDTASLYVDHMKSQDDAARRAAHVKLAGDTSELVSRSEARRSRLVGSSVDMRQRAYAVELFMEHQRQFLRISNSLGFSFEQLEALGAKAIHALLDGVPTLDVEMRMVARLESQTGVIRPNDVFDMQAAHTAIPYSTWVVAEKAWISRARQAKLHDRYPVKLSTSLTDLLHAHPQ